jgi:STE24 endopeptidase
VALLLFQFISAPMDEVIGFLQNLVSRKFEFQADGFAVGLGHGEHLSGALLRLEEENKGAMHVDPLYSAYHHSHPPLVQRLRAIQAGAKKVL